MARFGRKADRKPRASESSSVDHFLRSLGERPPLEKAEEARLAAEYQKTGCTKSLEKLITHNVGFIMTQLPRYRDTGIEFEDLFSLARIGMIEAAKRFSGEKKVKFCTYAWYWINQVIRFEAKRYPKTAPTTASHRQKLRAIFMAITEHREQHGITPSIQEIARATKYNYDIVFEALNALNERKGVRFGDPIGRDDGAGDALTHGETMADLHTPDPNEMAIRNQMKGVAHALLEPLSVREQLIMRMRFGIGTDSPKTLEEIGKELGITRERVRQIERTAKERIRKIAQRKKRAIEETILDNRKQRATETAESVETPKEPERSKPRPSFKSRMIKPEIRLEDLISWWNDAP